MLDVILRDIDPVKATSIKGYLKEMNDLVFLLTIGQGPFINSSIVQHSNDSSLKGEVIENNFIAKYWGELEENRLKSAQFQLFEGAKQVISISHTVKEDQPIIMRVVLDSDGEVMARKELEKGFKRQISHQAGVWMKEEKNQNHTEIPSSEIDQAKHPQNSINEQIQNQDFNAQQEALNESLKNDSNEISREIDALSQRVMEAMLESSEMIVLLNEMSYDFTRGAAPNISTMRIDEQVLENGATVELIDARENGYSVTFRKGSLNEMTEVSFFLEREGALIFSVYFSSVGNGKISAAGQHAEQVINRLVNYIGV